MQMHSAGRKQSIGILHTIAHAVLGPHCGLGGEAKNCIILFGISGIKAGGRPIPCTVLGIEAGVPGNPIPNTPSLTVQL